MPSPLYANNDYQVRVKLQEFVTATSEYQPAAGLNRLRAALAWTPGGAPIAANGVTLQVTLAEGAPGDYSGTLDGAALLATIGADPTNEGKVIYERLWLDDAAGNAHEVDASRAVVVVFTRVEG